MRPVPVPDHAVRANEHADRRVIASPDFDLTGPIRPVDALLDAVSIGGTVAQRFRVYLALDPGDLDRLRDGGYVVLSLLGAQMQPFDVEVVEGPCPHCRTVGGHHPACPHGR